MASRRKIYKNKTTGFGNVDVRRIVRAVERGECQRERRSAVYATNRSINELADSPGTSTVEPNPTTQGQRDGQNGQTEDKRTKLMKWKAERDLQKKINNRKNQPAFRAGVYHHKLNSPIFLHQTLVAVKPPKPASPRITRATAKRILAKKNATVTVKTSTASTSTASTSTASTSTASTSTASTSTASTSTASTSTASTSTASTSASIREKKTTKNTETLAKINLFANSFAPDDHEFKPPVGVVSLQLFGSEALDQVNKPPGNPPVYFSSYVVSARGKKASRKEQLLNIELAEHIFEATEKGEQLEESNDVGGLTPSYFRSVTENEVNRLKALCHQWRVIMNDSDVPEEAQLMINQAIGQTNLLIEKKIEQFKELIANCETGSEEKLVTVQDLHGFWDMVYLQVQNCDLRFNKLITFRERNWKEEKKEAESKIVERKVVAKIPAVIQKNNPSKFSSIRDVIKAARRKQMETRIKSADIPVEIVGEPSGRTSCEPSGLTAVKFDGGFFSVESPKRIVTPRSVRKSALLQEPKFSKEAKNRRSAINSIRISQILKSLGIKPVEIESDPMIPYPNSQQTPGKSILKRTDVQETSCTKKSQSKVNFAKTQVNLGSNLSWMDESSVGSHDTEGLNVDVKKRLHFPSLDLSDSEFDDQTADSENPQNSADKISGITGTTVKDNDPLVLSPLWKNSGCVTEAMKGNHKEVLSECNDETVLTSDNIQGNEPATPYKENKTMDKEDQKENEKPSSPDITKRKRSTRKSVRFTEEDCAACSDIKTIHPMTPRLKRRMSSANRNSADTTTVGTPSRENSEDLISFDTPEGPAPRVRRSLRLQNARQ